MRPSIRHNYRDRRHVGSCVDVTEHAVQTSASEEPSRKTPGGMRNTPRGLARPNVVRDATRGRKRKKPERTLGSTLALCTSAAERPSQVTD